MSHFPEFLDRSESSAFESTRLIYLSEFAHLDRFRNLGFEIWNWVIKPCSEHVHNKNYQMFLKLKIFLGIERRGKHIFGSIRHLTWNSCGSERAQFRSQSAVWIANAFSCDWIR